MNYHLYLILLAFLIGCSACAPLTGAARSSAMIAAYSATGPQSTAVQGIADCGDAVGLAMVCGDDPSAIRSICQVKIDSTVRDFGIPREDLQAIFRDSAATRQAKYLHGSLDSCAALSEKISKLTP